MKIVTVIGARPQIIKAAMVSREIRKYKALKEIILHTGQHFHKAMSGIFFEELRVPRPKYNLGINQLSHGAMTGEMLKGIERALIFERPDLVVVYGDTNSTLAGALAAAKLKIKVAHVEAGLRSFNRDMPEEINRILTDQISDILFCPTDNALKNLMNEGFKERACRIIKCGDVMRDAALVYLPFVRKNVKIVGDSNLHRYIVCTLHRQENTDNVKNLRSIVSVLNRIDKEIAVVLPLHPRTRNAITKNKIKATFKIIDPVGYLEMLALLDGAALVITDSGGLQKEAFFCRKHCLTLREETEWVELVDRGFNLLVGHDERKIYQGYKKMVNKKSNFMVDLYGQGKASQRIIQELSQVD